MKNLNINQMENLIGGVSGRGCMIAGVISTIAFAVPGGGVLAGLAGYGGMALADCFLEKAPVQKGFITKD
jgi:hypothetical protein